jgi:anhydro-N-acetylmuramic acid kinase
VSGLYLGLISGTSADGVDVALLHFASTAANATFSVIAAQTLPFPVPWRELTLALGQGAQTVDLDQLGQLDIALGHAFAEAAIKLCEDAGVALSDVSAIGSHGQTIRHRPNLAQPFSWQIGCPHVIAERTGVTVVADFRRRDVAAGGQGAPLVPAFHAGVFPKNSAVLNLGGIANVTLLGDTLLGDTVLGFDTGPANCLLDAHAQALFALPQDLNGAIAGRGQCDAGLLACLLDDPYFQKSPPKSTGREQFNLAWLKARAGAKLAEMSPQDVQTTLLHLSAKTVADALQPFAMQRIWVCGGGVHNPVLMQALAHYCKVSVQSTAQCGMDPDFVEAAAFAWLARETLAGRAGNRADVTGARGPRVLGAVISARRA